MLSNSREYTELFVGIVGPLSLLTQTRIRNEGDLFSLAVLYALYVRKKVLCFTPTAQEYNLLVKVTPFFAPACTQNFLIQELLGASKIQELAGRWSRSQIRPVW